ncbi:putative RNA methyltransferase [Paenibacillus sp. FSL R5-0407]|uniref:putative RNA methyltransferase n=1 Tax=Paenibacillus sp. FSL R5-0407 TaxID=2975320 RepID=UPI0030FC7D75
MLSKKGKFTAARLLSEYEHIFICPICLHSMQVVDLKSLICSNRHCFDLSKKGYVNLTTHALKTKYDKKLFEARKTISDKGFFEPLMTRICDNILRELNPSDPMVKILDAGCGEGSHLSDIQHKVKMAQSECNLLGVGIDISKEGIHMASNLSSKTIWCVADLAKPTFADKQFNFILNILSPSNYSGFQRILQDQGMVIKVIPEARYLQELRGIFYKSTDRDIYSNQKTMELFKHHFDLVDIQRVQYGVNMDREDIKQLVHMTPLSWGATEELKEHAWSRIKGEITFDFSILLGSRSQEANRR